MHSPLFVPLLPLELKETEFLPKRFLISPSLSPLFNFSSCSACLSATCFLVGYSLQIRIWKSYKHLQKFPNNSCSHSIIHNRKRPIKSFDVEIKMELSWGKRSRNSSDGIATGYRLDCLGSIPGRGKRFFSSPRCPDQLWGPPSLLFSGYLGVKWWGHEADHSPPSSARVKKGGAIPPLPHLSSWQCWIS
jgi:hypothetical protein